MFGRNNLLLFVAAPCTLLYGAVLAQTAKAPAKNSTTPDAFARDVAPLVKQFCVPCHGATAPASGLSLAQYATAAAVLKDRDKWEAVARNIHAGTMPPQGSSQPTPAQREKMVAWIESTFSQLDCNIKNPGRVTMRRLNREEYNHTIRDLIGLDLRPGDEFPSDDVGYGFDNIGDVLSLSPLLMEKYLTAAEKIARKAIIAPEDTLQPLKFKPTELIGNGIGYDSSGGRLLATNGELNLERDFDREDEYTLRVEAFEYHAGPENALLGVTLDGKEVYTAPVKATKEAPKFYETKLRIPAGKHKLGFGFRNDYYNAQDPNPNNRDRNLVINRVEIKGTQSGLPKDLPEAHRRILCVPYNAANRTQAARTMLEKFAKRAYRRPVTPDEVNRLLRYVALAEKEGESFERGMQVAVQATLVSPNFLFRPEARSTKSSEPTYIGQYEMASRLSYFLWSSMPDDTLLDLAAKGRLQDPKVLAEQAKRLLADPKAQALTQNFAGQWLQLRKLNIVSPDNRLFPVFNDELRNAMRTETELFFRAIVEEDRSALDFLDGKFTYVNNTLAKLYGLPNVEGTGFRKVALTDGRRQGILTQASILTVTSNPTRTSPVKRGKWVLEQILGTPPPPPPPNVPELDKPEKGKLVIGTLRERMEAHRKNPLCASCHSRMDPIGFGLENFNAVGGWRDEEVGSPIDPSGTLPDGKSFSGPAELIKVLKGKKDQFVQNLSDRLLTYALGRGLESTDKCHITTIAQAAAQKNYKFSALISAIVQSDPFRKRKSE